MPVVRIIRSKDYFGVFRQIDVYIDGMKVGGVKHDSCEDFYVRSGVHLIHVAMDWVSSKPYRVELDESDSIELTIKMQGSRLSSVWRMLFAARDFYVLYATGGTLTRKKKKRS